MKSTKAENQVESDTIQTDNTQADTQVNVQPTTIIARGFVAMRILSSNRQPARYAQEYNPADIPCAA
ncbi:MAG: hypothetical protein ACI8WB_001771 [Phenylobacterium sp.]